MKLYDWWFVLLATKLSWTTFPRILFIICFQVKDRKEKFTLNLEGGRKVVVTSYRLAHWTVAWAPDRQTAWMIPACPHSPPEHAVTPTVSPRPRRNRHRLPLDVEVDLPPTLLNGPTLESGTAWLPRFLGKLPFASLRQRFRVNPQWASYSPSFSTFLSSLIRKTDLFSYDTPRSLASLIES